MESLTVTTTSTIWLVTECYSILYFTIILFALNQAYSALLAIQQQQINPGISNVMTQQIPQVQMRTSHPQVQLPQQQIGDVGFRSGPLFTSPAAVCSSNTSVHSTSQPSVALCSHTPTVHTPTVHTPVTTVLQRQKLLYNNTTSITTTSSSSTSSSSPQVHTHKVNYDRNYNIMFINYVCSAISQLIIVLDSFHKDSA